jgi:hypothetical protein
MQGLDVGNCDIMLHVRVCEGLVRQLDGSIEKRFARKELLYPIQVHCSTKPLPGCHACVRRSVCHMHMYWTQGCQAGPVCSGFALSL